MPNVFNQRVVAGMRVFGWLTGLASILLGISVLIGWLTANHALVTVRPGLAAMSPITAVAFTLAGLSIVTSKLERPRTATALAIMLMAISLAVLVSYAATGDDLLNPLLGNQLQTGTGVVIGRTAPATACGLFLLGICLLSVGKINWLSNHVLVWSSACGLLVSGLALLGYAYGVEGLYAVAFYRSTAVHTAASLFALFLACFVHEPERGWAAIISSGLPSGSPTRVQLLFSILVPFLIGLIVLKVIDVAPSLGIAIVVSSTMVPLVLRILHDGRMFDVLETQRRVAVEAQIKLTEELEERVQERTASLATAEARLRQSQKMEAIGQLTGGLAHDFNNLLTGVSGSLEMISTRLEQGRVSDVERYVVTAKTASRRAATLTHRLLSFSRRQTLEPRATDVNRLVVSMDELVCRTMGPGIAVEVVTAGGLWTVFLDPPQLENALLNLCINARDAMPEGGRLTIETANRWLDEQAAADCNLPSGQYVSLCVSDTGTGMPPEVIERAFDPFFTTKPIGEGTGLGLSMTYGFAQQSGGQVRIYSEVGKGTTVCLYLPRHIGEAETAEASSVQPAISRADPDETVLVVDDEAAVRMLVTDVLEDLGYRAIAAADGAAGLRVLQSTTRIDLLISDVGLPGGMNGRQVADAARLLRPNLKVLFITGYAENAVLNHGHLEPGMHVLTKPFALDVLSRRIKAIIDNG